MIEISLPFPATQLMPNRARRNHWAVRAQYAQTARGSAKYETLNALPHNDAPTFEPQERIPLRLEFHPPDLRPRDLDNCLAACKAYIDGVSEALGINDKMYAPIVLDWGKVTKGGKVILQIGR